jgi:monoamine oxidase
LRHFWFYKYSGGAQEIANDMKNSLSNGGAQNLTLNAPVRSISQESGSVVVTGDNFSKTFQNVISTIPLPVMRTLDLSGAGLSPIQSNALRELNYGPAVKIGLLFDEAWWTTAKNNQGVQLNIVGGQSYTDSILRTVVYPSFGDIAHNTTTTLIATYCWTEDAARFGALMNISPAQDTVLQNLVLRELDRLHDLPPGTAASYFKEMHAWSWAHNPYSMGEYDC